MELLISIYIIISILFFFTYSAERAIGGSLSNKQIIFVVLSFATLLFFHCAVEINSVEDLWSYEARYKEAASLNISNFNDAYRTKEYVFNYFSKFVSYISDDFRLFLVIYNIILFSIYYTTFKKYTVNVPFAIICMILCVYFQSIFVLRQHLAIAVLLLSIPFILKKKLFPYLMVCVCAFYIHMSAIAWLPIFFIYNIRSKKKFLLTLLIIIILFIIVVPYLENVFTWIKADYTSYLETNIEISVTKKLIYISYLVLYVLTLKEAIFDDGMNRLTSVLLFFCTIGYLLAPPVSLVDRMLTYYSISLIFALPLICTYLRSDLSRCIFVLLVMVLQGYVSIQPLSADYYKNFSIVPLELPYYISILLSIGFIYKYYRRRMI